jgi:hypothetical protein
VDTSDITGPREAQRPSRPPGNARLDAAQEFERLYREAQDLIDKARRLREESLALARAPRPIERASRP